VTNNTQIIDYTAHPVLPAELKRRFSAQPFDAIIDTYGSQPLYRNCASYLKPTGTYHACTIHYNSYTFPGLLKSMLLLTLNRIWPKSRWLGGTGRTFRVAEWMQPSREMMEELVEMCVTGKLRVARDREWEFEELKEAMGVLEGGHARGKVVVKVDGEDGDE
jgi:NADPH:quinone reductase-like Zn-dependent oxidoreductase